MTVAAVFAEQGSSVPQTVERLLGYGERAKSGEQHPALHGCADRGLHEEVGAPCDHRAVGQVAQDVSEGSDATTLPGGEHGLRRSHLPDARDACGDLAWGKVVEQ